MSLDTTLARAASREADRRWDDHVRNCPQCNRARRKRDDSELCHAGQVAKLERKECAAELAKHLKLDNLPAPNQDPLFTDNELGISDGTRNSSDRPGRRRRTPA